MTVTTAEATDGAGTRPAARAIELHPQLDFPDDRRLADLPRLFDPAWAWGIYERQHGQQDPGPERLRIREFSHMPGRAAALSYEAEWNPDAFLPSQVFTIRIERDQPPAFLQYPDDPNLPGLKEVADPVTAIRLINQHVLAMPARRARVELVRYRPGSRAVLRHYANRTWFYARAMRPPAAAPLLAAGDLVGRSGFVVPRLAGFWAEGSVLWVSEIPGENLRHRIRRGRGPEPEVLLDAISTLWNIDPPAGEQRPFNLDRAYRRAKRSFNHKVREDATAARSLAQAVETLDPFVESWQPSGTAHNDFYDDQMLRLRDGRVALVDYEEAGPGDPLLDVGNFLAHLRWAARFGRKGDAEASGAYYEAFRDAALRRFGWNEADLSLREGVCLFRVCTNAIRHPRAAWRDQLREGLALVNESLG